MLEFKCSIVWGVHSSNLSWEKANYSANWYVSWRRSMVFHRISLLQLAKHHTDMCVGRKAINAWIEEAYLVLNTTNENTLSSGLFHGWSLCSSPKYGVRFLNHVFVDNSKHDIMSRNQKTMHNIFITHWCDYMSTDKARQGTRFTYNLQVLNRLSARLKFFRVR